MRRPLGCNIIPAEMLPQTRDPLHRAALLVLLSAVTAVPALAQNSRMTGRVVDRVSRRPIPAAEIRLISDGRSVSSDSAGHFSFGALPGGSSRFIVRAPSFPDLSIVVDLPNGQESVREIELDSTAVRRLEPILVTAPAAAPVSYRLVDFERRRNTGRGQYLTEEEIIRSGAMNLQDAVRPLRGVTEECAGAGRCVLRMSRAPMHCQPDYVIDERINNDFGPFTPIRDIVAIEVYTGPSDVPGEFAGRTAGCGVIVIWTRTGPPARRRPE
jgi:Carboxypeptidase regulatory-like domain